MFEQDSSGNMTKKLTLPNDLFLGEVEVLLRQGQPVRIKPRGRSMEPFIHEETDEVILQKVRHLAVGQIVLAHLPEGNHVLHRVIRIKGDTVILMGDGNLHGTEQCTKHQVYGIVSQIIRGNKTINVFSKTVQIKAWIWRILLPFRGIFLNIFLFI